MLENDPTVQSETLVDIKWKEVIPEDLLRRLRQLTISHCRLVGPSTYIVQDSEAKRLHQYETSDPRGTSGGGLCFHCSCEFEMLL